MHSKSNSVEVWILNASVINMLEALKIWLYRRVPKIPWTAKMRNVKVLRHTTGIIQYGKEKKNRLFGTQNEEYKIAFFVFNY